VTFDIPFLEQRPGRYDFSSPVEPALSLSKGAAESQSCPNQFSRQLGSTFISNNTAWEAQLLDLSSRADPDFLPRGTGQNSVCAIP
jgi:hypothetical protein